MFKGIGEGYVNHRPPLTKPEIFDACEEQRALGLSIYTSSITQSFHARKSYCIESTCSRMSKKHSLDGPVSRCKWQAKLYSQLQVIAGFVDFSVMYSSAFQGSNQNWPRYRLSTAHPTPNHGFLKRGPLSTLKTRVLSHRHNCVFIHVTHVTRAAKQLC
jgi:hypothetical protein